MRQREPTKHRHLRRPRNGLDSIELHEEIGQTYQIFADIHNHVHKIIISQVSHSLKDDEKSLRSIRTYSLSHCPWAWWYLAGRAVGSVLNIIQDL